jgi:putative RecB family exonuclease
MQKSSLPVLREQLHVSVSQVKTYLRCPRQYELRYVRGVKPAFVPVALAFGSAFHAALSFWYLERRVGRVTSLESLVAEFGREWLRQTSGPIPLQKSEEDEETDHLAKATQMLTAFHLHASTTSEIQVEAVERAFAVDLHDTDTGEALEEKLVGAFDLVLRDETGRYVVVEHKTAARRWSDEQLKFDGQMSAYQIAARQLGLGDVALRLQIVTKAKLPAVQIEDVTRDRQDEDDFHRCVVGVLRAIDAKAFYPVRSWACKTCPVAHACNGGAQ